MAFTGTPVVTLVGDGLVRVTGVSLLTGDEGILGTANAADAGVIDPFVLLPEGWHAQPFQGPDGSLIGLVDSVQVWWVPIGATGTDEMPKIQIVKSEGPDNAFAATFTNLSETAETNEMEIYLRYH